MKKFVLICSILLMGTQVYSQSTTIKPETFTFYSIPHSAFIPEVSGFSYSFAGGGFFFLNGTSSAATIAAPINLPHHSRIISIEFTLLDNSTSNLSCKFIGISKSGGQIDFFGVSTSGTSSAVQTITINPNLLIDNSTLAYFVRITTTGNSWTGNDLLIYSATIQYTIE